MSEGGREGGRREGFGLFRTGKRASGAEGEVACFFPSLSSFHSFCLSFFLSSFRSFCLSFFLSVCLSACLSVLPCLSFFRLFLPPPPPPPRPLFSSSRRRARCSLPFLFFFLFFFFLSSVPSSPMSAPAPDELAARLVALEAENKELRAQVRGEGERSKREQAIDFVQSFR